MIHIDEERRFSEALTVLARQHCYAFVITHEFVGALLLRSLINPDNTSTVSVFRYHTVTLLVIVSRLILFTSMCVFGVSVGGDQRVG